MFCIASGKWQSFRVHACKFRFEVLVESILSFVSHCIEKLLTEISETIKENIAGGLY